MLGLRAVGMLAKNLIKCSVLGVIKDIYLIPLKYLNLFDIFYTDIDI